MQKRTISASLPLFFIAVTSPGHALGTPPHRDERKIVVKKWDVIFWPVADPNNTNLCTIQAPGMRVTVDRSRRNPRFEFLLDRSEAKPPADNLAESDLAYLDTNGVRWRARYTAEGDIDPQSGLDLRKFTLQFARRGSSTWISTDTLMSRLKQASNIKAAFRDDHSINKLSVIDINLQGYRLALNSCLNNS